MSIWSAINILVILLWLVMAVNVLYIFIFSIASLLPARKTKRSPSRQPFFLVLYPSYHEDTVILDSIRTFLHQDYPKEKYQVVVISDHMRQETNECLASLPITLLQPTFEKSSKAKALQYAVHHAEDNAQRSELPDYVVILDADNVVEPDFLTLLSEIAVKDEAIQCHRTAKNSNNDIAALDGLSEEINNSIFRRGHNRLGMSSALIGSGMCFSYEWFSEHVNHLDSAVEDRELEALLMRQGIFIRYAEDILVMDEKVSNSDNFQRQRLRWMTGQVQAFFRMLPHIPKAIATLNVNYIDKTLQQALIPRSILLLLTPVFAILATITSPLMAEAWALVAILFLSLFIAIPAHLRSSALIGKALALPALAWRMMCNLFHIKPKSKEFIHTTHDG